REISSGGIFIMNARDMAPTSKQCLDVSMLSAKLFGALHVILDAGILFEIGFDVGSGLARLHAQLAGQSEGADSINDAEIYGLGFTSNSRIHLFQGDAEDLAGGEC